MVLSNLCNSRFHHIAFSSVKGKNFINVQFKVFNYLSIAKVVVLLWIIVNGGCTIR